jgi:hypothetical protein
MDSPHFDTLVKQFHVIDSRRGCLRVFLSSLVAGGLGLAAVDDAAAFCKGKGELCKRHEQCCSSDCKKKRKNKKGKAARSAARNKVPPVRTTAIAAGTTNAT